MRVSVPAAPPESNGQLAVRACTSAAAWNAYLRRHAGATGYHRFEWGALIGRVFGHDICFLAAESSGGIQGILPLVVLRNRLFGRFVVSLPFLNYGGVVADTPDAERLLLEAAIRLARENGATLELRHTRKIYPELADRRHKVAMTLPLRHDPEAQWNALDRKVRNQVRKAEKSGMQTAEGGLELLDRFYHVFARNMRDLGTPVYTKAFFRDVLGTFPDSTRVFAVYAGHTPVAASLVVWHGGTVEVPWASSLREFNTQAPNMLLYWRMLRFAAERGFRTFDFGRSTPGEGTFHFKRQWGAEPAELVWEYWTADGRAIPNLNPANPRFRRAIALWQHLPLKVTTLVGPHIVRHIP